MKMKFYECVLVFGNDKMNRTWGGGGRRKNPVFFLFVCVCVRVSESVSERMSECVCVCSWLPSDIHYESGRISFSSSLIFFYFNISTTKSNE